MKETDILKCKHCGFEGSPDIELTKYAWKDEKEDWHMTNNWCKKCDLRMDE